MAQRKQVATRVAPETKQRWSEYADETHGSMTSLIRQAVDHYVDNDVARSSPDWDATPQATATEESSEVAERIDALENTIESMQHEVTTVRESVQSSEGRVSLRAAVRETVPEDDTLSARQIAARLNVSESAVSDMLDTLETEGEVMQCGGTAEETYWQRW